MPAAALLLALSLASVPQEPSGAARPARDVPVAPPPAPSVSAAAPRRTVSLHLENDIIAGTDQDYTSGFSLAYSLEGRGPLGGLWDWLGNGGGQLVSSYELEQLISTPTDISREDPDPADRPYAGVLFGALATQSVHGSRLDGIKVLAGVVGPASLAEPIQRAIHAVTGSLQAHGWKHQLRNELLLNATSGAPLTRLSTLPVRSTSATGGLTTRGPRTANRCITSRRIGRR